MTNNKVPLDKKDIEDGVRRALVQRDFNKSGFSLVGLEVLFISGLIWALTRSFAYGLLSFVVIFILFAVPYMAMIFSFLASIFWALMAYGLTHSFMGKFESVIIAVIVFAFSAAYHGAGFQELDDGV